MDSMQEFEKIKQAIASDLAELHKAKGRLSLLKEDLKKIGLNSRAEAEAELERLRKSVQSDQSELNKLMAEFRKTYGNRLQNLVK